VSKTIELIKESKKEVVVARDQTWSQSKNGKRKGSPAMPATYRRTFRIYQLPSLAENITVFVDIPQHDDILTDLLERSTDDSYGKLQCVNAFNC
jgi:hypothetical protein